LGVWGLTPLFLPTPHPSETSETPQASRSPEQSFCCKNTVLPKPDNVVECHKLVICCNSYQAYFHVTIKTLNNPIFDLAISGWSKYT
jgi:hypothetical protein